MGMASSEIQVRSDLAAKAVMNSGFPGSLGFGIEDKEIVVCNNKYQK